MGKQRLSASEVSTLSVVAQVSPHIYVEREKLDVRLGPFAQRVADYLLGSPGDEDREARLIAERLTEWAESVRACTRTPCAT